MKEETTQKKNYQDEDKKSAINKKIFSGCRLGGIFWQLNILSNICKVLLVV